MLFTALLLALTAVTPRPEPVPCDSLLSPVRPAPDRWLGLDKFWHLTASFAATGAGYHLLHNRLGAGHRPSAGVAIGATAGLGIGKELLDRRGPERRFSWRDLAADAAGIAAGYVVFIHSFD
jgi:uncharacterized protein YfiM (DUF2279 family)